MLRKEIGELIVDIFSLFGEKKKKIAESDPEACLVSLLLELKKDALDVSSMTKSTVQRGLYQFHVERARQLLNSTASQK